MDDARTKPPCHRDDAIAVVRALRDAGHVAYFAGGCVRDVLLGREPKDYDVATDAVPQKVRSLFRNTQAVGQAFGVILVRLGRSVIEVATFRDEGSYLDGRRPSAVWFTTAELDAQRRDFTINGLFLDPVSGQVIDHVGGQADLKAGVLRAIGNPAERFAEDHLRLLRAVRFAARFGFTIDPATDAAIRRDAPKLVHISPERIADELRTMLTPPTRAAAYRMLIDYGLLDVILRFTNVSPTPSVQIFNHVARERSIPFGLALAALATDALWPATDDGRLRLFRKPSVQKLTHAIRQALRPSNDESELMEGAMIGVSLLIDGPPPTLAMKKRFLARPTAPATRELQKAIAATGVWRERQESLEAEFVELEQTDYAPPPLVTGDDLTAAGLRPGPLFKRILDAVYDAQLEGRVTTKDAAMALAMESAKA